MSSYIPPFLLRLELDADADERAVRKAYAREVKQIDQQTQAREFQMLREAYDAALTWCRNRKIDASHQPSAQRDEPLPAQQPEVLTAPPPPAVNYAQDKVAVRFQDQESVPPVPVAEPAPEPAVPAWLEQAQAAFPYFLSAVRNLAERPEGGNLDQWILLIQNTLADARWQDLRARPWLEYQIAVFLARGWRNGHQFLFVAAIEVFQWKQDQTRLRRLGDAGPYIDRAMIQFQDFQEILSQKNSGNLLRAIERLRNPVMPNKTECEKLLPVIQPLINRYPEWLNIITGLEYYKRWREQGMQFPATSTQLPAKAPQKKGLGFRWLWVLLAISAVFRMFSSAPVPSTSYPSYPSYPSTPAAPPFPLEQHTAPPSHLTESSVVNPVMAQRIGKLIRPKIHYAVPDSLKTNPEVSYIIQLSAQGNLIHVERNKSSGLSDFDEAVRLAIELSQPYPSDFPRAMVLVFRPR